MIVCSCNRLSDRHFRETIAQSPAPLHSPARLYRAAGCSLKCGRCVDTIRQIMAETVHAGAGDQPQRAAQGASS